MSAVQEIIAKIAAKDKRYAVHLRGKTTKRRTLPCLHEGPVVEPCTSCAGEMRHVRSCFHPNGVRDKCTRGVVGPAVQACSVCSDYEAPPVKWAPLYHSWTGGSYLKPWEYPVTIGMAHLNTIEELKLSIAMWRHQTMRPYFQIVDTGSHESLMPELEKLRAEDVEIHYVRSHAYRHSSAPVSVALDLIHALCQTQFLFHTHTDVFPFRKDFIAWLQAKCSATHPVVGWQMSPRATCKSGEWKQVVSHTATMVHMPTARKNGLQWNFERYYDERPHERGDTRGWPDTESPFYLTMQKSGLSPVLLGTEPNYQLHPIAAEGIEWAVHARSYTGLKMASDENNPLWVNAKRYMEWTLAQARTRLQVWNAEE